MKFNIRGEKIEVTEALKDYIEKKITRLEKYFEIPLISEVYVTLSVNKNMQTIEVAIPLTGAMLRAEERNIDMYASIDLVVDKLERQIRKHKTKVNRKIRQEGGKRDLFKMDLHMDIGTSDEDGDFEVVRTKSFNLKPMDIEEAILQMNLIGHNFFVFENMDSQQVNVVYLRNDGKYGLIEPVR
jgi:putative sigma-54 modulation protein